MANMSDELLCDPCQRLFQGKNRLLSCNARELHFAHHTTAKSFQQALALPCSLCRRIWAAVCRACRYDQRHTLQMAQTAYVCRIPGRRERKEEEDEGHVTLTFSCSRIWLRFELMPRTTTNPFHGTFPVHTDWVKEHASLATDHTSSDLCMEFASFQLRECRDTHDRCRRLRLQNGGFLPTRMINVGGSGASTINLFEPEDHAKSISYIALSHCWGNLQPLRLTRATALAFTAGIPWESLPKTFQDAVHVTRKLQVQYLWIDSLCIIQDDPEDWQREAALMQKVYTQAICCIAATAAKDSSAGLFFARDPQGVLPLRVDTTRARICGQSTNKPFVSYTIWCPAVTPSQAIDAAPLNQRAWVAQERYLSPGVLHFTQDLIFWECYDQTTSEQDLKGDLLVNEIPGLKWWISNYRIRNNIELPDTTAPGIDASSKIYKLWCRFRANYSGFHLTNDKDILVALNGVAQDVAGVINDTLVAGLWRRRLIEDMCWIRKSSKRSVHPTKKAARSAVWRAPTWSWASMAHSSVEEPRLGVTPESYKRTDMVTIEAMLVDQKPSGELIDAAMTIKCRLISLSPPKFASREWEPYPVTVVLDDSTSPDLTRSADEINLVILCRYDVSSQIWVRGILVVPGSVKTGSYERIGYWEVKAHWFDVDDTDDDAADDSDCSDEARRTLFQVLNAYDNTKETTIKLV